MENAPTIRVYAFRVQPEYEERLLNWVKEVYLPLFMKMPGYSGIDIYKIARENFQYARFLCIFQYPTQEDMVKVRVDSKFADVTSDMATWASRFESIWFPAYQQVRTFINEGAESTKGALSDAKSAPVMHIEGYTLSPEEEQKYESWFAKWGYGLYIPLLMRLPGLKEYACYQLINVDPKGLPDFFRTKRPVEYPSHLSILHFESMDAFDNYARSIELAGFHDHLRIPFPGGIDFKWHVQYKLQKGARK